MSNALVYLLHFDTPYYHAQHYLGSTVDLARRLQQHAWGTSYGGARLLEVINQAGIAWHLVRTWDGGRALERELKNRKNGRLLCPLCNPSCASFLVPTVPDDMVVEEEVAYVARLV
jgi:predicted GIY-YIG superfamily endonuclease